MTLIGYGEKIYREHGETLVAINLENMDLVSYALTQIWSVDVFPLRECDSPQALVY